MKFLHVDDMHKYFAGGCVAAFLGGLAIALKANSIDFEAVFLAVICILLRSKFWIDDREYFLGVTKGTHARTRGFKVGVTLAILSWFPWILAGLTVGKEDVCSALMFLVFVISTLWIMSTWLDQPPYPAQIGWMFYNVVYGGCFFMLWQRHASWFPLPQYREVEIYGLEGFMLLVLLFDVTASGTLNALAKISEE